MAGANSIRYVLEVDDQGSPRLIRFGQNAQHAGQQAQGAFNQTSSASSEAAAALGVFAAAGMATFAALSKAASAGMAIVEASAKYDALQVRLRGIEGGAKGATLAFEKLQELSKLPGLGFEQAADAYAGLRSLKQDGPEAVAIIEAIARANASMGGGAEQFGRAMKQVQQIIGKGKLQAEDLNTIAESIPNFRALMLDAFGTTSAEAINAKYSMDEFLKGIVDVSKTLPASSETIVNNIDNISDAWTRLKASFGDFDAIKKAAGTIAGMIDGLAKFNEIRNAQKGGKPAAQVNPYAQPSDMGILDKAMSDRSLAMFRPFLPSASTLDPYLTKDMTSVSQYSESYSAFMATLAPKSKEQEAIEAEIEKKRKQTMKDASGIEKKASIAKSKDSSVDFSSVDKDAYRAAQMRWNESRGVNREVINPRLAERRLAEMRKEAAKKEQDEIFEISEKEIKHRNEVNEMLANIQKKHTDRIQGYYIDLAQSSSAALAQSFAQIGEGFGAMADAMLSGFKNMMIQMAAEVAANAVVFGVLNLFSGGAAGTFAKGFSGLSGLLMGHATGGYVGGGEASIVGERRSEIFVPRSAGRIEPTTAGAGQSITIIVRNPAEAQSTARALRRDARQRNTGLS